MGKLRYEPGKGRPLSFERGRHFKNTNGNNVCRGDCGVISTEELGLQMFKEVMRGLDRINPSVDQFESGGGTSLPGSTRSAGTTDF